MPQRLSPDGDAAPRVLFLDAYDSFTNNIVAQVELELGAQVTIVKVDDARYLDNPTAFRQLLSTFDAVIAGPGPGRPQNSDDVGLIADLWGLPDEHLLPVLGVCLGFQSLALACGAIVTHLCEPRHGIVSHLEHRGESLFAGLGDAQVVQYHSLHASIWLQRTYTWDISPTVPSLRPLAWILDDEVNGPTLMSVVHTTKPFWGVQFHPESVCTMMNGASIFQNWWLECRNWAKKARRVARLPQKPPPVRKSPSSATSLNQLSPGANWNRAGPPLASSAEVKYMTLESKALDVIGLCDALRSAGKQVLLLESGQSESGKQVNPETGRFSILGVVEPQHVERILYFAQTKSLFHCKGNALHLFGEPVDDVWAYIKTFMTSRRATGGPSNSPFWGGLIGYATYEACLQTIGISPRLRPTSRPDVSFMFVTGSIVLDHLTGQCHVQSIAPYPNRWLKEMVLMVKKQTRKPASSADTGATARSKPSDQRPDWIPYIKGPGNYDYEKKVTACQRAIRDGESYELCLTDQTRVYYRHHPGQTAEQSAWSLYRRLRRLNPAPFSAFLHFPDVLNSLIPWRGTQQNPLTILSSSPERFLSWDRRGSVQLRPIKGTVAKTPGMTRARAESILSTSKERAENLMIVDLIRHDLHGVVGAGNVDVAELMQIEEYENVFQLVSVIEGTLKPPADGDGALDADGEKDRHRQGIDVLAASLPPGSMTGAPKKRSCELLHAVEEGRPRSVYSGVMGHLDVGGGGDFAVVIRTAWSWGDEAGVWARGEGGGDVRLRWPMDVWHVGAGGAVTSQSTPEGEWAEMLAKRDALMRLFTEHDSSGGDDVGDYMSGRRRELGPLLRG